ncbi:hypothetical protein CVT26_013708 [Gymnopilus dilepis]|uniref:Uncharacterized protein n=1 Tax=Gymnopilus dilepis TaxID=231916 RepID=A0A409YWM3_9AGAR|nr:hypothetical protein CVT26_013708 [Gymnopilus dilepis]
MEKEAGDDYIRRLAAFIRTNEKGLAEAAFVRRKQKPSPLPWPLSPPKPVVLSTDTHHLFYVLIRLEALGFNVGLLDVPVISPSRPMSYVNIFPVQKDPETLSLASLRSSLSLVSNISLSGSWWTAHDRSTIDGELKYIYSSFTKIPALSIHAPGRKVVAELLDQSGHNAVALDVFKNLQRLECNDIDPRVLLGWDRLADSLGSLTIKRSGLDDISQVFLQAVVLDQARRHGQGHQLEHSNMTPIQRSIPLPSDTHHVDVEGEGNGRQLTGASPSIPSSKWCSLKHLYLPDNSLTSFPSEVIPYLTSLTHLDLSSNLFVAVPSSLAELTNLVSLNISDNLIDSVQGISLSLGQILYINLAHNRLESLCGLERLLALERIDLRHNLLDESSEIGRLTALPNLSDIWLEGNPFTESEEDFRVACFSHFSKEDRQIRLDGNYPSLYEKRNLASAERLPSVVSKSTSSAPVISIERSRTPTTGTGATPRNELPFSTGASHKRKKVKRIVDLEETYRINPGNRSGRESNLGSISEGGTKIDFGNDLAWSSASGDLLHMRRRLNESVRHTHNGAQVIPSSLQPVGLPSLIRQHSRHRTEYVIRSSSSSVGQSESFLGPDELEGSSSKSERRRARVSASLFEPATMQADNEIFEDDSMDIYRKRIESLKQDMGDSWLKVYSQTHSP